MVTNRREKVREATYEEIKSVARHQMAETGPAGLSLRQIATQMGIAAPSLYNYYKSRDELITALIVDAYNSSADALEQSGDALPADDYAGRVRALMNAYRNWAVEHATEFMLIAGSPIPGYDAPDITMSPARRSPLAVLKVLLEAFRAGKLHIPTEFMQLPPSVRVAIQGLTGLEDAELPVFYLVLHTWAHVQGLVTLELYHHLQPIIGEVGPMYQFEVEALVKQLGLAKE